MAINFLLSPEAQARKADTNLWGDPTILTPQAFKQLPAAYNKPNFTPYPSIAEPNPTWLAAIEHQWQLRYGN